jgi:histidine ammonia-lyase
VTGRSGIRPETVQKLVDACNAWCLPYVPEKGTVGASGDLAPLAHLALGLMGEGMSKRTNLHLTRCSQARCGIPKRKHGPMQRMSYRHTA